MEFHSTYCNKRKGGKIPGNEHVFFGYVWLEAKELNV